MGILDTLKDVATLVQKVDNIELVKKIMELQTQVTDLAEENRSLKEELTTRESLTFEHHAYWRGEPGREGDGPYCSRCWDVTAKLVRMHYRGNGYTGCTECDTTVQLPWHSGDLPGPIEPPVF